MQGTEGYRKRTGRLAALAALIVAAFVVLSVRLYDLQVVHGSYYAQVAEQNRLLRLPLLAERGVIYDRTHTLLARNLPAFAVRVLPADVPKRMQPDVARQLGRLLSIPPDQIAAAIDAGRARTPYELVTLTRAPISRELALLIEERGVELPGVRVEASSVRQYVDGPLYAGVLGYVGPVTEEELSELRAAGYLPDDSTGRDGIERTYEGYLRGAYGVREVERDAAQREVKVLAERPPVAGRDLVLTLDDKLQRLIAAEIAQAIADKKMTAGVGIALNPQNGEVLALVNVPSYDNNVFIRGITERELRALNSDPARPLVNKAIGEIYPPGSTFKLVTALAALNEGVVSRSTVVNVSSNVLNVGGYSFYDWRAHGPLDFINGFAHSSDIYFYTLGGGNPYTGQAGVGPEKMAEYARALGMGKPTGIDVPGEAAGIIPDPDWKRRNIGEPWTLGNTYHMAIGQGYDAITPLQLVTAYAALANDGTVYRPHVLKEVVSASGEAVFRRTPQVERRLAIRPEHLRLVREAARRAVTIGHAYMPNAKLPIAGKTGTAEFGAGETLDAAGRHVLAYHNWFVSFLPKQDTPDPTAEIAMVIFAYKSSENCQADFCPNPAIAITQKVYETYLGGAVPPKQALVP